MIILIQDLEKSIKSMCQAAATSSSNKFSKLTYVIQCNKKK